MKDNDKLAPAIARLLTHLVKDGPIVGRVRADVESMGADDLIEVKLAEIIAGPDRAVLRATFAGRRLVAMWADRRGRIR